MKRMLRSKRLVGRKPTSKKASTTPPHKTTRGRKRRATSMVQTGRRGVSRFTEEERLNICKEALSTSAVVVGKKYGIPAGYIYKWAMKFRDQGRLPPAVPGANGREKKNGGEPHVVTRETSPSVFGRNRASAVAGSYRTDDKMVRAIEKAIGREHVNPYDDANPRPYTPDEVRTLHEKIGALTVENEILKDKLGRKDR